MTTTQKGYKMLTTVTLTKKQIEQLLWAISLTQDSYAGWTTAEMGAETASDLRTLARAEASLLKALEN